MKAKVMSVKHVGVALTKSLPPILVVSAKGEVNSGGWSNGDLVPYVYVAPPPDGVWDFDFIAQRPSGPAVTVISSISTDQPFAAVLPKWCRGVRVHSATGAMERMLDGNEERSVLTDGDPGDAFPWVVNETEA